MNTASASKTSKKKIINQNKVNNVQIVEYFNCFCRRQYLSFSALYLHLKLKHKIKITIDYKDKLKKRIRWSGSKKEIIYEAEEEMITQFKNHIQIKSIELQMQMSNQSKIVRQKQKRLGVQLPIQLHQFLNEFDISKLELGLSNKIQKKFLQQTVIRLYQSFDQKKQKQIINGQCGALKNIPHFLNEFMVEHIAKSEDIASKYEQVRQILLQLSKWLYQHQYSPYLAVRNTL